ncbi:hypothetical protein [Flavobacterium anhuiense]|uniref:hypothetical protein n=1 Tax=Flavobacterium anhuiense TaxID=459526 RepID=UPI003D98F3FF
MKIERTKYYHIALLLIACFIANDLIAQTGMMSNDPNKSVALDINAPNKGVLIPQINLQSTSDVATIVDPAVSLMVYNTNAAISGNGAKGAGYYFYDGTNWKKLIVKSEIIGDNLGNHTATQDLNMQANKIYFNENVGAKLEFLGGPDASGIGLGSNYTTVFQSGEKNTALGIFSWSNYGGANKDVVAEKLRLTTAGYLGVGTSNPAAMLHVAGSAIIDKQLKMKKITSSGTADNVVTADNNGLVKLSDTNVNAILQTCYYNMSQVGSNSSQSIELNSKINFFMFTVTTTDSCGKNFCATFMIKQSVMFYMNNRVGSYVSTVLDPNGNSLDMKANIGASSCTADSSQVNYTITLTGKTLTIQNTNASTPQNYSIDMIQLG